GVAADNESQRLQQRFEKLSHNRFLGVPTEGFAFAGREQVEFMLRAGLQRSSRVLDIGCGVLRAGYWLIRFLDVDCYCGIEPSGDRLAIGKELVGSDVIAGKRPRFDCNARFESSVFGDKFDFFLAYSIWTHASKLQIAAMLDLFLRDSRAGGTFLATFLPANWLAPDYRGVQWLGTSHESDVPGLVH